MSLSIREQLQATLGAAYTLERELSGGGMSKVFVADEHRLKRKVVVKVLPPELAQTLSVERFEREIQTAAALQHANIVPVLSAGDTGGLPFYMMPFVEGESLRDRIGRGPLAVTEVLGILRDVTRALAYAHEHGVVHRDIKPDNVLLSGGAAVVTDFGIAKAISAARTGGAGATLTQIGTSIGTPAYMAPEQAAGDPTVDQRADLYALGAMAYELLTGEQLFAGRTPQRMMAAHMGEAPRPVAELRPDTPASLAELVMSCLAKEPSDRPRSAADIVRSLEVITSGTGIQAMPAILIGGAGMLRRALLIYVGAFVAVAVLARAAIVGIGLPDWVYPGSLIVMALGLPVVLWTGYVHRVARRAGTMTPTFTPGGTPSSTRGTIATLALKAAPRVSWYRTARGGAYAMGAFVAMIAAFMGMRAFGIGPFGSLLASGALQRNDAVLFTDFTATGSDSTLGRVVSDAVQAGLVQSNVLTILTPERIAAGLRRMQRPVTSRLDLALARQLAQREGAKAVVDGDVTFVGGSYILAVRLVTADSGRELTSARATASGPDKLIEAADAVSRQLRGKAGESLRKVQGGQPLAQVTTGSLEALRRYSEASRLISRELANDRAEALLREAVTIDSQFAEAWRKLAAALDNQGKRAAADSANTRAYQLRDRLNDRERDLIVAYYFISGPGRDRGRGIAAYQSMLARGDSHGTALNNLAQAYSSRREFARAESLLNAYQRRTPESQLARGNLLPALQGQGKWDALDSSLSAVIESNPRSQQLRWFFILNLRDAGRVDAYRRALDSARTGPDPLGRQNALFRLADLHQDFGQVREAERLRRLARQADPGQPGPELPALQALDVLNLRVELRLPFEAELRAVERELAREPFEQMPASERPYLYTATALALAGRPDAASRYVERKLATAVDTAERRELLQSVRLARSRIAFAERNWNLAVQEMRMYDQLPDGPNGPCVECLSLELFDVFSEAGMADSAIAQYEAYKRTPMGSRRREGPDLRLSGPRLERLAEMYELKDDTVNASAAWVQFIELWKDADPELQPRVAAAREKLRRWTLDAPRR